MNKYNEIRNRAWKRLRPELMETEPDEASGIKIEENQGDVKGKGVSSATGLPSLQSSKRPVTQNKSIHARSMTMGARNSTGNYSTAAAIRQAGGAGESITHSSKTKTVRHNNQHMLSSADNLANRFR